MSANLPVQVISPGLLGTAFQEQLNHLKAQDVVSRFWARDTSLWPTDHAANAIRKQQLNWLDLPDALEGYIKRAMRVAPALREEFESAVFLAMGSSNLAAEVLAPLIQSSLNRPFFVVDTLNPFEVRAMESRVDIRRSLFLAVSKTGKAIETHALLLYFLERLKALGVETPGKQFVAATEEQSYLGQLAREYHFRHTFLDPAGFPGRFSGVIHFSLLLCALCGSNPGVLLAKLRAMRDACGPRVSVEENAAATLAALLAAGAANGCQRLAMVAPENLISLARRLGQLVGASTCKFGFGIVPLVGVGTTTLKTLPRTWMAATFKVAEQGGEKAAPTEALPEGTPTISTKMGEMEDLCEEIFRWEIATCMACALLEVNPFSEPDVEEVRKRAAAGLDLVAGSWQQGELKARILEGGVELYAERNTRHEISMLSQADALRTFLKLIPKDGYLAILSFLPRSNGAWEFLQELQKRLERELGIPVMPNQGPRYLRIAGQWFKGGPPKGHFLILTEKCHPDIRIPGAGYTFGDLAVALAEADFRVLDERRRPTLRVHLSNGVQKGMGELEAIIEEALVGIRKLKRIG